MYRIIKITKGDNVHFEIQKRYLRFFWSNVTESHFGIDGTGGDYVRKFESIYLAENYIKQDVITMEIVKTIAFEKGKAGRFFILYER